MQKLHLSKRVNIKSNLLLHKMMQIFPFPPGIKFTHPYHNYYGSSFYRFMQLELLICTSTSVFKHFLYTNMPYICNAKIGCNFITLTAFGSSLQLQRYNIFLSHNSSSSLQPGNSVFLSQNSSSSSSMPNRVSFQHTQLQYFCPEIPQQRAGYSTSLSIL